MTEQPLFELVDADHDFAGRISAEPRERQRQVMTGSIGQRNVSGARGHFNHTGDRIENRTFTVGRTGFDVHRDHAPGQPRQQSGAEHRCLPASARPVNYSHPEGFLRMPAFDPSLPEPDRSG